MQPEELFELEGADFMGSDRERASHGGPEESQGVPMRPDVPVSVPFALLFQAGIGQQIAFQAKAIEPVPNDRERRGYRLPTEEEWRFACFGESATPFPYGHGEEFFAAYGFASAINPQNVGRLMPNDRGLFDMLGNACEWCERPGAAFPTACGGSYLFPPATVSALCTDPNVHPEAGRSIGFRVARTWR